MIITPPKRTPKTTEVDIPMTPPLMQKIEKNRDAGLSLVYRKETMPKNAASKTTHELTSNRCALEADGTGRTDDATAAFSM